MGSARASRGNQVSLRYTVVQVTSDWPYHNFTILAFLYGKMATTFTTPSETLVWSTMNTLNPEKGLQQKVFVLLNCLAVVLLLSALLP